MLAAHARARAQRNATPRLIATGYRECIANCRQFSASLLATSAHFSPRARNPIGPRVAARRALESIGRSLIGSRSTLHVTLRRHQKRQREREREREKSSGCIFSRYVNEGKLHRADGSVYNCHRRGEREREREKERKREESREETWKINVNASRRITRSLNASRRRTR